jgi:YD repeat-containing protein
VDKPLSDRTKAKELDRYRSFLRYCRELAWLKHAHATNKNVIKPPSVKPIHRSLWPHLYARLGWNAAINPRSKQQHVHGDAEWITSSNGLNVPFVRDSQGRITQITDTLGNNYSYSYDGNGNLANVTYPGIATPAQYQYDSTHLLTQETDQRGNIAGD